MKLPYYIAIAVILLGVVAWFAPRPKPSYDMGYDFSWGSSPQHAMNAAH